MTQRVTAHGTSAAAMNSTVNIFKGIFQIFLFICIFTLLYFSNHLERTFQMNSFKTFPHLQHVYSAAFVRINPFISNTSQYQRGLDDVMRTVEYFEEDEYLRENSSFFNLRPHVVSNFIPEVLNQVFPLCPRLGPFLLVAMPSVHSHTPQRDAIRRTWGSLARGGKWPWKSVSADVRMFFFVGVDATINMTDMKAESERHGDIVLGNFLDTYRNLSVKTAFILHWKIRYCSNAKHLLKVDEDTFVNIPLLMDILYHVSKQHKRYIIGYKHVLHKPPVLRCGHWAVDESVYPLPYFPRYTYGHSYVISRKAVKDLLTAYKHMPLVPVEDAFFTGILAKIMGITRIHCPRFASTFVTNRCLLLEDEFVSQTGFRGSPADYHDTWSMIVDNKCGK